MSSMTPVHTRKPGGKLYRYYSAIRHLKGGCGHCEIKRVSAREIEALVLSELQTIFMAPEMLLDVWSAAALQDDSIRTADVQEALADLVPVWNELFPKEQERLIKLMLDSVVVYPDAVDVRVRAAGLSGLVRALGHHTQRLETANDLASHFAAE